MNENIARYSTLVDFLNTIWIEHIIQNLGSQAEDQYEITRLKQATGPTTRGARERRQADDSNARGAAFPLTLRMLSKGYLGPNPKDATYYRQDTAHFDPWRIVASMTTESSILSELSVEQILGGKVRSTFFTPGCVVTRYVCIPL